MKANGLKYKMEGENMELCSTYIETDKFNEVIRFYETVFQKKGNI